MTVASRSSRPGTGAPDAVPPAEPGELERRNRRTAVWLLGWIGFLMLVALVVIWMRN